MNMHRRAFLQTLGVGAGTCALPAAPQAAGAGPRPNIIYIMSDDQRWDTLGCYGGSEFRSPNIDDMAANGVVFTNAFFTVSICMASRATILHGQYVCRTRCDFDRPADYSMSHAEFDSSYPRVLQRAGYRTGFIGKFGFAVTPEKVPEGRSLWGKESAMPKDRFDFWAGWPSQTPPGGYHPAGERYSGKHLTDWCGDQALEFLRSQPNDRPFCLSISFFNPKGGGLQLKDAKPEHLALFKDAVFPYPPAYVDGADPTLPVHLQRFWRGPDVHQRETVSKFYQTFMRRRAALIYGMDLEIGRIRKELERLGMAGNTILMFSSDNGYLHGEHGAGDKAMLYEGSVRAPLVVYHPLLAAAARGRRERALVSTVDYAPTICDLAGVRPPEAMQGVSFRPLLDRSRDKVRDEVFMEQNFTDYVIPSLDQVRNRWQREMVHETSVRCRGIRTPRWKYIVFHERKPRFEELYDLQNDPVEKHNLVNDPRHRDTLHGLRVLCQDYYDRMAAK